MAAITATVLQASVDGTDRSTYTTGSISPAANKLILMAISGASDDAMTVSGCGLTWVEVGHSSTGGRRITLFRAMGSSPTTGALTISYPGSQFKCFWSIVQLDNTKTSGSNGADAIVQFATDSHSGGSTTGSNVTLAAFSNVGNATFGAVWYDDANPITQGSGFTELSENAIESSSMETEFKNSNDTSVDWTWGSSSATLVSLAVEIALAVSSGGAGALLMAGL